MAKKKSKQIIRPWCWYCEREFEDEKVLMQHQKAKHFKCNMCPRRLNTAGGLAVHIQQVHKLEPENLPRIENALPGRDGYEVEIFGMEGIPAPDVADYKRRKEIELGLNPGTISQPPSKRPKIDNRPLSEEELKAQLEAHKALMGASETAAAPSTPEVASGAVYGAPPQTYAAPPTSAMIPPPSASPLGMPPVMPPGAPPFMPGAIPPPGFPGAPPFPPMPGMPMPPGPPPGFPMPPFAGSPPPGMLPPGAPPGTHFPPGVRPPFPPPPFMPPGAIPPPGFSPPPNGMLPPPSLPPTPMPPVSSVSPPPSGVPSASAPPAPAPTAPQSAPAPPALSLPNPSLAQTNPPFKKATVLKWSNPNFSLEETRAVHYKYYFHKEDVNGQKPDDQAPAIPAAEESRGKKRARAEDFL
ncbi:hypothetical protein AcV5_006609 [Taiwanofungus camphoratus]|nr:hypothetical protein AcV5_006609 [Antrodia cinnamomea]